MLPVRIVTGEEALWVSVVFCTALIIAFILAVTLVLSPHDPFHVRIFLFGKIIVLSYSGLGVYQCSSNTDFAWAKWLAIIYAVLLGLLLILSALQFGGWFYGSALLFVLVGIWCKLE